MADFVPRGNPALPTQPCEHAFTYREVDGETWNVCTRCGFGELWAGGTLVQSTDMAESNRLDGWSLRDA